MIFLDAGLEENSAIAYIFIEKELVAKFVTFNFIELINNIICYYYVFNLMYPKEISQTLDFCVRFFYNIYPNFVRGNKRTINNFSKINSLIKKLSIITTA